MPVSKIAFAVAGRGPFPIDMLRYDCAWPARSEDANTIATATYGETWEVKLYGAQNFPPTFGRWESFNCRVLDWSKTR